MSALNQLAVTSLIPFTKVESVGNDFPLIELEAAAQFAAEAEITVDQALASLAIRMSDRHFGVGGDGLLSVAYENNAINLRMFNSDGTEDFCGNGLRCAAAYATNRGWVSDRFDIFHGGRRIGASLGADGRIETLLGAASYSPPLVPHNGTAELWNQTVWSGMDSGMPLSLFGSALTTGSTHVVIPTVAFPDDDSFKSISRKIENDLMFPKRTSVIWRRETEPMRLAIRIWERGVGETRGCGTGSSAAAIDYLRTKNRGGAVVVVNPGGTLWVTAEAWDQPVTILGTARLLFNGRFRVNA